MRNYDYIVFEVTSDFQETSAASIQPFARGLNSQSSLFLVYRWTLKIFSRSKGGVLCVFLQE